MDGCRFCIGGGTKLYIGLADFKVTEAEDHTNPWYNGAELVRQMNACAVSSEIAGTIHFRYQSIAESLVLQKILSQSVRQNRLLQNVIKENPW